MNQEITYRMKSLFFFVFYLLLSPVASAQSAELINAHEAIEHVGEYAVVCGVIASTSYRKNSRGRPTYLNFDRPYPDQDFSAVVFGDDRKNFKIKPETLTKQEVCVIGMVKAYKGKAQIVLVKDIQLKVRPPE